jgi:hypothetical protein
MRKPHIYVGGRAPTVGALRRCSGPTYRSNCRVPIEGERQHNDIRGKGPCFACMDVAVRRPDKGREQDAVNFVRAS